METIGSVPTLRFSLAVSDLISGWGSVDTL